MSPRQESEAKQRLSSCDQTIAKLMRRKKRVLRHLAVASAVAGICTLVRVSSIKPGAKTVSSPERTKWSRDARKQPLFFSQHLGACVNQLYIILSKRPGPDCAAYVAAATRRSEPAAGGWAERIARRAAALTWMSHTNVLMEALALETHQEQMLTRWKLSARVSASAC